MNQQGANIATQPDARLSVSKALCLALGCLSTALAANQPATAELEIAAPENWYQVEVIIFTHQGDKGTETAPRDYQLEFPKNWRELVDPTKPELDSGFPLADSALLSEPLAKEERSIPLTVVQDPALAADTPFNEQYSGNLLSPTDATMAYDGYFGDEQALWTEEPSANQEPSADQESPAPYAPRYEPTHLLLDKQFRDLNDSAKGLNRRGYDVVFHEAWRIATEAEQSDPWMLIKAGQTKDSRHQVEGALRFYKSRFLHFQSNLWLLQFGDTSGQLIDLPDYPIKPEKLAQEINLSESFVNFDPENLYLPLNSNGPEPIKSPEPINSPERLNSPEPISNPEITAKLQLAQPGLPLQPPKFRVDEVWVLDHSKRIDLNEIYYIDHPLMGVIVTIKSYQPELLNPPQVLPESDSEPESQTPEQRLN